MPAGKFRWEKKNKQAKYFVILKSELNVVVNVALGYRVHLY